MILRMETWIYLQQMIDDRSRFTYLTVKAAVHIQCASHTARLYTRYRRISLTLESEPRYAGRMSPIPAINVAPGDK